VVRGSPASAAGLRSEDLITEVAGQPVSGMDDLQRLMDTSVIGRSVPLRVHRGDRTLTLDVTPTELAG